MNASSPKGSLTVADVLDRAADLIEPEGAWTQREDARSKNGRYVEPLSRDAVSFCMWGAIERAAGLTSPMVALNVVGGLVPLGLIAGFNDAPERTQPEVVAKLREAAAKAREQGL